jgi:hypothetical protein
MQSSHIVNVSPLVHVITGLTTKNVPSPRLTAMKRCAIPICGAEIARPKPCFFRNASSVAASDSNAFAS